MTAGTSSDTPAWGEAGLTLRQVHGQLTLEAAGDWVIATAPRLDQKIRDLPVAAGQKTVTIDLAGIGRLDTAGAWLLRGLHDRLAGSNLSISYSGVQASHRPLLDQVERVQQGTPVTVTPPSHLAEIAERTGAATINFCREAVAMVGFLGLLVVRLGGVIVRPRRLRWTSVVYHMEATGLNAMPIVGLLSFLIGLVLAYQGADQLRRFGAEVFVVNLVGISTLREMGVLITSIIVAGRSGSAFTAQIGTMKVNQEVDAMYTLGLDPAEILVLPRMLALLITLPLLTFYANVVGLLGGALMSWVELGITFSSFMSQLQSAVAVHHFWAGMIKAPVFAAAIAMVGCYEGLQVTGSAESVGRLTTQSVVVSIFLVIILDAIFSILFSKIGI